MIEFAFPGPLREQILSAIHAGMKTATSSLLLQYEVFGEPLPAVGERGVAVDSEGAPRFRLETTDVAVVPLAEVTFDHALAEGEGYRSVEDWRSGHEAFWASAQMRAQLGEEFELGDETLIVLERFKIVD